MQSLQYSEHLSDYLSEILYVLRIEYDHERLGEDVLREIGAKSFSAQDSKSPRSFGRFLVRFTELNPATMRKSIATLRRHLDSESYPIRNAMLEVVGLLIRDLVNNEDGATSTATQEGGAEASMDSPEARKKQIEGFWELLLVRYMDLNSYVRSKTITICNKLLE